MYMSRICFSWGLSNVPLGGGQLQSLPMNTSGWYTKGVMPASQDCGRTVTVLGVSCAQPSLCIFRILLFILGKGFVILVSLVGFLQATGCAGYVETARVEQVIDGDTIFIVGGERVRYIGIDAPEMGEPFYYEAKRFNEQMVAGRCVKLEKDVSCRDDYGRLLRYVYVDGIFVNGELVRNGYALAKGYPPDTKYQAYLEKMEDEAKRLRKGLWR